jgi:type I restriction enzyme, S subunit
MHTSCDQSLFIDLDYLCRVLENYDVKPFVTGSTRAKLTKGGASEILIPLPPIAEQKRIAAILDKAEEIRSQRRQALEQLDAIGQSIFLEMFGNPIHNTKNWPLDYLKNLSSVKRGKFTPRPRNDPSYYGGAFPFIQTGDISNSSGYLTLWNQTLNEKGIKVSRSFPPRTVVIAIVGATLGITSILGVEVYCPDSVVGIQTYPDKSLPEYIERVLRFWRPIFVAQAPETARANINLETLRPLQIPVPPIALQQEFARRVETIAQLKATHRESLTQLDALFASLQHRAFRGEL